MQMNRQNQTGKAASSRKSTQRQRARERLLMKQSKVLLGLPPDHHTERTLSIISSSIRLLSRSTYKQDKKQKAHRGCSPMLHTPQNMQGLVGNAATISPQPSNTISGGLSYTAGDHFLHTTSNPVLLTHDSPYSVAAPILQPAFPCTPAATSMTAFRPPAAVSAMVSAPHGSVCTSEQYLAVQLDDVRPHLLPMVQPSYCEQTPLAAFPRFPFASSVWHASLPHAVNTLPLLVACPPFTPQLAPMDQAPHAEISAMPPAPPLAAEQHTLPQPITEQPPPTAVAAMQSELPQKQCLEQPDRSLRNELNQGPNEHADKRFEAAECLIMMRTEGHAA